MQYLGDSMLHQFKKMSLALCLVGFNMSAWSKPTLVQHEQGIYEYRLENGLRVVLAPNDKESKIFINTIYLTGSLNDPDKKSGMAHLLEHLAFKGTKNIKDKEFQRRLDQFTLSNNASTDFYSTRYMNILRPASKALKEVLHLEAERMDKLVIQKQFVAPEIEIVKRERELRMDQPDAVLIDQVFKAAYGNQFLGRLPIGDLPELKSIQLNELNQFYRTWYAPNNAVLVISGKFNQTEVLNDIEQNFTAIASRPVPEQVKVPVLDAAKIKARHFLVEKGSDLAVYNLYLGSSNPSAVLSLATTPLFYTMEPSGRLYKEMVEKKLSLGVQSATWLDQNINLVFLGTIYAPTQDEKAIYKTLNEQIESKVPFGQVDLDRVKSLTQTQANMIKDNSVALGARLSDYVVTYKGQWTQYFKDLDGIQQLEINQVNQDLQHFLTSNHRLVGEIKPTKETQNVTKVSPQVEPDALKNQNKKPKETLKNISQYQKETQQNVAVSAQLLKAAEQKIQRGQLSNGMRYALYPVPTRDNRTYATLSVNFGTEQSLFNQKMVLNLMSYLLLRGTEQYNLQQVADKTISAGGFASAVGSDGKITIKIQAPKDKFDDYFQFILALIKNPKFDQTQFDLIKAQSLGALNRP